MSRYIVKYSTTKKMNELIDRPQFDQLNLCLRNNSDRKF